MPGLGSAHGSQWLHVLEPARGKICRMDDKYDEAIAWLRQKDRMKGSYYEEVASLMEELLGRLYELEMAPPKRRGNAPARPVKPRLRLVPGNAPPRR
jgi:hypothetical protein